MALPRFERPGVHENVFVHMVLRICALASYVFLNVKLKRAHSCLLRLEQLGQVSEVSEVWRCRGVGGVEV